jgi:hypothetical protein
LSVGQILNLADTKVNDSLGTDQCKGWSAVRTCDLAWNMERIFPKHKGNVEFWFGVACGQTLKDRGV